MSIFTIQPNAYVTLDYTLRDDDGRLLDASDAEGGEPIRYIHGYGMLVPGLEGALAGMRVGDARDVVVSAETGFGEYDDELVLEVDRGAFPDPASVQVGDEFVAESPDGEEVSMRVVEVRDEDVTVDANHPLAGVTLHYSVKVLEVREATDAELEQAAAAFEEAEEHVHGPDCDHGDGELVEELVPLAKSKKKPDSLN